ncbi:hypothetical protein EDD15DRAFT_2368366 [Pisolithus albus]|nr:hypothetical protein EDD15DRAFT_2368366 [Pisolithus albus]
MPQLPVLPLSQTSTNRSTTVNLLVASPTNLHFSNPSLRSSSQHPRSSAVSLIWVVSRLSGLPTFWFRQCDDIRWTTFPAKEKNWNVALPGRFLKERKIGDLNEAITLHRDALKLRPVEDEGGDRSDSLHELAFRLFLRYETLGTVDNLEEAVALGREALALRPPGHPVRDFSLNNLGAYLRLRFKKQAEVCDLEEAIQLLRAALELRSPGHQLRSQTLSNLILCLSSRYESRRLVQDLEELVTLRRAELELYPRGHSDHVASLHNLARDLRTRYARTAAINDLKESIELHRAALELRTPGDRDRSSTLHELTLCLSSRYDRLGMAADLEQAIEFGRAALKLLKHGHPSRGESLHNLACNLRKRFMKQTAMQDLEEAIELLHAALELRPIGHPDRPSSLCELAFCLSCRHGKHGVAKDLKEAVTLGREALKLCPQGHPNHGMCLRNLGRSLIRNSSAETTAIRDLEESIELLRRALELHPIGHPDRPSSLYELALCLSLRHDKHGVADGLEEAILLGREALGLYPPGHSDRGVILHSLACDLWKKFQYLREAAAVVRPTSRADLASALFNLSQHLWDRFQEQVMMTDLDDAICLATYALELQLPPEDDSITTWLQRLTPGENSVELVIPGHVVDNLHAIANYHRARFQNLHDIVDLNEGITFYRRTLQFRPSGHPNHASSLHDLAQCLADRFREQTTATDLDEAIALQQEALHSLGHGEAGYDISRRSLATYVQMKIRTQVAVMSSDISGITHLDVAQAVRSVAFETLKTMPTRLLHTHSGILCNRDAQVSHFLSSPQYRQLVSQCKTCEPNQQMELIRTEVSRHFQYVTLSHRWGSREPSLLDIEGRGIYSMPAIGGLRKLQGFCAIACESDYLWAWSDTCCIDQHSSAELQQTIGSMFAWYRRSALTVVYLSDVPDTGSLGSSEWFRRGWTLQELLAPRTILFYTQNWTLYKNLTSANHKEDAAVLAELARETGIEPRFLTDFCPGVDNARSRLQWASSRLTTQPEDIAYSLFGIFNLHLPVLYGESAEHALFRLLTEIVSRSGDISVLDWVGESSPFHSCFPAHIKYYQCLPPHPYATEQPMAISEGLSSCEILPDIPGSPTVQPVQSRTPDSNVLSEVHDIHSPARVPLARFFGRLLALPCIPYQVIATQLKGADPSTPNYTYSIQASGLTPLDIALSVKLEDITRPQAVLHLVRPWHSKLLGPSTDLDAVTDQQILSALGTPFNALLLTELPHNEHKRIASSTLITAQPVNRASILNSKIRIFNVV